MSFKVIKSGVFTTIQDKGRFSLTHLGVTHSGYMDEYASLAANRLLENKLDTNLLEIAFANIEFEATKNTCISITGAYCDFYINENLKETWKTHNIKKGDRLKITKINQGQRIYLAVKNGFNISKEFGSNSTTIKESLGGIGGRQIKNGDILEFEEFDKSLEKRWHRNNLPIYEKNLTLRVLLSYQENSFSKEEKEKFFNSEFEITADFNRMACKLKGEAINSTLNGIVSEAIAFGSIQIPKDGQPIILLKERQTIGGYPKIGSVLSIDCFKLAQMKIGSKIRFKEIDIKQAQKKLKEFYFSFS